MQELFFPAPLASNVAEHLRLEVRAFLRDELPVQTAADRARSWMGWDEDFSRKMGQKRWVGMTWPKRYGGHERSGAERYVVLEEMLAAGAPVCAHWVADRQSGPMLLRFGTEEQRSRVLPRIAAGECSICIGMSEPDAGSDLAAVRTRAIKNGDGYRIAGTKLWSTNAHRSNYMILLCRTGEHTADRHAGLSQFLIDLSNPDIEVRPIADMAGDDHFNEVVFHDAYVPATDLIGNEGDGWKQVTSELALERSGPERFLSSFPLFADGLAVLNNSLDRSSAINVGRLVSQTMLIREMSRGIASMIESGADPQLQAAIVKDLGSLLEQEIPDKVRHLVSGAPVGEEFSAALRYVIAAAPSFSLRGGTREILRTIIARGLGLR